MKSSKQGIVKNRPQETKKDAATRTSASRNPSSGESVVKPRNASWSLFIGIILVVMGGAYGAIYYLLPKWDEPAAPPAPAADKPKPYQVDEKKRAKTIQQVARHVTAKEVAHRALLPSGSAAQDFILANVRVQAPAEMVWIPSGKYHMGASLEKRFSDATDVHEVELDGFWMDRTEVTNAQFARFVHATGYRTVAEQKPKWEDIKNMVPPGTPRPPDDVLVPGSLVFTPPPKAVPLNNHFVWWRWEPGACWFAPEGPKSTILGRENHPVVHVCWVDAAAYAKWANKRLPTEAEWEYAARGGLDRKRYVWGDELSPKGKWLANIWQGRFPVENKKLDGHVHTAPVGSFPPNGFGLYDVSGNVWEWCSDWYRPDYYKKGPKKNPRGPKDSFDPNEQNVPKRVQRGGSFLCSDLYCIRYLPAGRGKGDPMSGASHVGFRCARSAK